MSKKGCSPDNSACEGFFGCIKNETFPNTGLLVSRLPDRWFHTGIFRNLLPFMVITDAVTKILSSAHRKAIEEEKRELRDVEIDFDILQLLLDVLSAKW